VPGSGTSILVVEQLAIPAVAKQQPVVGVEQGEALLDAFDGIVQPAAGILDFSQICLLDLDGGVSEHGQRLGHPADLVDAWCRERHVQVAVGDGQHAAAESFQPGDHIALNVEPDDQEGARDCQCDDRDQDPRGDPLRRKAHRHWP
jgi:hypothetical protein